MRRLQSGNGPAAALDELRRGFGLARIVLRGPDDRVLAVAPQGAEPSARAAVELNPETLFALDEARYRFGDRGLRLPEGGGCLRVTTVRGLIGLHLWEADAHGFDEDARQALAIAASALGLAVARREAGVSCIPAIPVLRYSHEDPDGAVAGSARRGDRGRVSRPPTLEVRCCSRASERRR